MAITFAAANLASATKVASGITIQSAFRDALVNHPSGAWTLVEEFDSASGGACHWVVVKNSTSVSGHGVDFYVVIGRIVATGDVILLVCEGYDSSTHTMSKFAPYSSTNDYILADMSYGGTSSTVGQTYVLGGAIPGAVRLPFPANLAVVATVRYEAHVDIACAVLTVGQTMFYLGAFSTMLAAGVSNDSPPVGIISLTSSGGSDGTNGSFTRHPCATADVPMIMYYPFSVMGPIGLSAVQTMLNPLMYLGAPVAANVDRMQGSKLFASEINVGMIAGFVAGSANNVPIKAGILRAKMKPIVKMVNAPSAAGQFDTINIDGTKHSLLVSQGYASPYTTYLTGSGGAAHTYLVADTGS